MKKFLIILVMLASAACIRQTVHHTSTYLDGHSFAEVWGASIKAVYDIDFTVDSMDQEAGFISAESGTHVLQEVPPRLTVMIIDNRGKVFVECRLLQKEQFIDILGHGKRTTRRFLTALNVNLNHGSRGRTR
ncbi:MAG: hypothetical protein ACERK6_14020 [Candidatus Aminicenantaceae bacterium]